MRDRQPHQHVARLLLTVILALSLATSASAGDLSPQEVRGKQIYFQGTSPRGEAIAAYLGADATRLPGAAATCAGCHGADGRGRPEAGVIPSDVTWEHLLKPYGHRHVMGRRHPAFTEDSLKDAIRTGRDPAGNHLDPSMPVYEMADADLDDLLAYLRRLKHDFDPGITETALRIGTILPTGRMTAIGGSVREVLEGHFAAVNARGGIYGRRLVLVEALYDDTRESPLAAAERLLEDGGIFALLSPVVAGADSEISALVEERRLPMIGPVTLYSPDPWLLNDFTFYLFSGVREQVRVLVDFAARELELADPGLAVLGADAGVLEAIARQRAVHGWSDVPPAVLENGEPPAAAAARLAAEGVEALVVLDRGDLGGLLAAGETIGWRPQVLVPGAFVGPEILDLPTGFANRVHLAYPTAPSDVTRAGAAELARHLEGRGTAPGHRTSQVAALAAAKILTAGLKGAGRELSRDKLLRSLEQLHEHPTGLTPAVTYGANRRVGALGAHTVAVDLEHRRFVPGGWRTPREEI